jgi:hypothetical protein
MTLLKRSHLLSRRSFLARSVSTGLVMGVGIVLPGCSEETAISDLRASGASRSFSPNIWFEIDSAGLININISFKNKFKSSF